YDDKKTGGESDDVLKRFEERIKEYDTKKTVVESDDVHTLEERIKEISDKSELILQIYTK
ncbi:hypothetical protein PMAYCL1PPCAC_09595, partial [Pristionchus mayeri]